MTDREGTMKKAVIILICLLLILAARIPGTI